MDVQINNHQDNWVDCKVEFFFFFFKDRLDEHQLYFTADMVVNWSGLPLCFLRNSATTASAVGCRKAPCTDMFALGRGRTWPRCVNRIFFPWRLGVDCGTSQSLFHLQQKQGTLMYRKRGNCLTSRWSPSGPRAFWFYLIFLFLYNQFILC